MRSPIFALFQTLHFRPADRRSVPSRSWMGSETGWTGASDWDRALPPASALGGCQKSPISLTAFQSGKPGRQMKSLPASMPSLTYSRTSSLVSGPRSLSPINTCQIASCSAMDAPSRRRTAVRVAAYMKVPSRGKGRCRFLRRAPPPARQRQRIRDAPRSFPIGTTRIARFFRPRAACRPPSFVYE